MLDGVDLERKQFVGSAKRERPKLNLSVEQIVMGALAWRGCRRYLYRGWGGEMGVIWADSEQTARHELERHEIFAIEILQTEYVLPKLDDIIIY